MHDPSRLLRLAAGAALCAASGCTQLGPASIANGRAAYTDVITRTNDEQLLGTLVRLRYAETTSMLMVTAVTSQTELTVDSAINLGFGQHRGYDGNLVPFSAGGSYRESPTISYEPLTGAHYLKQMVTPISLELYGLMVDSLSDSEWTLKLLTASLAGLDAPVNYQSPRAADLQRALTLMASLNRAGALDFAYRTGDDRDVEGVDIVLDNNEAASHDVAELLKLLRKPVPEKTGEPLRLELQMGRIAAGPDNLRVLTRSPYELLRLASHGVQVPDEQLAAGIAPAAVAASAAPFVHVHCALTEPTDPFVSVQYRGYWFWVESNDTESKRGFSTMQTLLLSCLQEGSAAKPQLTLPVN
ncbi:MAG TPA: hypothetical protein VFY71_14740 [Planctomycetota bacterium]|nr:hypothetical protein [Planctomycetota bacterium]